MGRKLSISKRLDLDMIDGWKGKGAFLNITPINFGELNNLSGLDKMTDREALDIITNMIKSHFLYGKVIVYNEETKQDELVDAELDDLDGLPVEHLESLFEALSGGDFSDPKGRTKAALPSSTPTATSTEEPSSSVSRTETPSLGESPAA